MKKQIILVATVLSLFAASSAVAGDPIFVYDSNGNGSEFVTLVGSRSFDLDGAIVSYAWRVNTTTVATGFGPVVQNLTHNFLLGRSTVTLTVFDDVLVSSADTSLVTVLPQSSNLPPVADATVPGTVSANSLNVATVTVDASLSSDPNGDPIYRYLWTEGSTTLSDSGSPMATFTLSGLGLHTVRLEVFSRDGLNITQSGFKNFSVTVVEASGVLAGFTFRRVIGEDFPFTPTYDEVAGIAYNALTQTYAVTDNQQDKLLIVSSTGGATQIVDISGLKAAGELTADAEGITWMYGSTWAVVMEGGEELAVIQITPATTALTRANARIYDLAGDPKGVAYHPTENAIYYVSQNSPMRVAKMVFDAAGNATTVFNKDLTGLPASELSDIAIFPRLSQHPFLISGSSRTIMEVNIAGVAPVVLSQFTLAHWNIPDGSGLVFSADGRMHVTSKSAANTPEDTRNVFAPDTAIPNQRPQARINGL